MSLLSSLPTWSIDIDKPFIISESIGGGHAECGSAGTFSLQELLAYPEWKSDFEKAGCSWAITIIEANPNNIQNLLDDLVNEVRKRSLKP